MEQDDISEGNSALYDIEVAPKTAVVGSDFNMEDNDVSLSTLTAAKKLMMDKQEK